MSTPREPSRRALLATVVHTLLLSAIAFRPAWAGPAPSNAELWMATAVELRRRLQSGEITVVDWQRAIESANDELSVPELKHYFDVDKLTRGFSYSSALAEARDPVIPPEILGPAGMRGWFIRVFGLRRGGAIVPHVHNNMVSAHLVISGSFHARTHDRISDVDDAVVLRPTLDEMIRVGQTISMSDQRHNQHWLVAQEDRSMTLDVGIVGLDPSWPYGLRANSHNMIYVDPTSRPQRDGTIIAPVIDWNTALSRFAAA